MKKVSLDVWVQLIGLLSIVGGLVFVGLEMRQSQQIALERHNLEHMLEFRCGEMERGLCHSPEHGSSVCGRTNVL